MLNNIFKFLLAIYTIGITNILFFSTNIIQNDSPEPWAIGFQDGIYSGYTYLIVFFGLCSELCGTIHWEMSIVGEMVRSDEFISSASTLASFFLQTHTIKSLVPQIIANNMHSSAVRQADIDPVLFDRIDRTAQGMLLGRRPESEGAMVLRRNSNQETEEVADSAFGGYSNSSTPISTNSEAFPWLCKEDGIPLNTNMAVDIEKAVELVTVYLGTRFGEDTSKITGEQLHKILEPFFLGKEVSIMSIFQHVSTLLKDKSFEELLKSTLPVQKAVIAGGLDSPGQRIPKYLGDYGEQSVNKVVDQAVNLKWDFTLSSAKLTVNVMPTAVNIISYGLILNTYVKHVHNRPYAPHILADSQALKDATLFRRRSLLFFALLGAPFVLSVMITTSVGFKNMFAYELSPFSDDANHTVKNISFLTIFTTLNKWMPWWFKHIIRIVLLVLVLGKLIGLPSWYDVFIDIKFLKYFFYIIWIISISYLFGYLYFLNRFYKKNITIPKILPVFMQNWFKEFESLSKTEGIFADTRDFIYRVIVAYLIMLVLSIFIFFFFN